MREDLKYTLMVAGMVISWSVYYAVSKIAAERKSQVGTGDRSERIRTYNYPQGRMTDHRIGLTLYKLDAILNGDLDEIFDALITSARAEQLKASIEENGMD